MNAGGRKRDVDEIYIPFPAEARAEKPNFFPPRNEDFRIILPNGAELMARVCQDDGKAIMSNPNKALGHWLLREVFELPPKTLLTYGDLQKYGIDSVVFEKIGEKKYSVNFCLDSESE